MVTPHWITCPHCGEKRDSSNRFTSPANAERDARRWREQHESGACVDDDRTCKRCGDTVATLSTDDLCDGCVAEDDRPNLGQEEHTMKTIEEVAAEVAADWHEEGQTRDADRRLAIEAIRAWEAQGPQDEEIYIVTDEDGDVLDVFATKEEAELFRDDRDDLHTWEETVWAPGAYAAENAKLKANKCDQCDEPATNHWPKLIEPVQMCDSCTHNARRSGWEPGQ